MPRILIIDDEKAIRNTLKEILEFEDYKVDQAEDGPAGLDMLIQQKYDVVLCDIRMPKMDGLEVLERAQEMGTDAAFIMVSAHGSIDTAVEATKKGAYDFLSKPPDLNRLLVTVRNALDRTKLVTETKTLKKKLSVTPKAPKWWAPRPRWAPCARPSRRWPPPMPACSSPAPTARARRWWPASCTSSAAAPMAPWWR